MGKEMHFTSCKTKLLRPRIVSFFYLHAKPVIILREPSLPAPSECLGWTRGHAPRSPPPLLHHCTSQLVLLFRIAIVVDESSANARRPAAQQKSSTVLHDVGTVNQDRWIEKLRPH